MLKVKTGALRSSVTSGPVVEGDVIRGSVGFPEGPTHGYAMIQTLETRPGLGDHQRQAESTRLGRRGWKNGVRSSGHAPATSAKALCSSRTGREPRRDHPRTRANSRRCTQRKMSELELAMRRWMPILPRPPAILRRCNTSVDLGYRSNILSYQSGFQKFREQFWRNRLCPYPGQQDQRQVLNAKRYGMM